jgi:O-antigen/teichoic acid export membrane protein
VLSYLTRVLHRPLLEARYGRLSALVNVAVTLALTPFVGLLGVCVGTAVGQVVGSLWFIRVVRRATGAQIPSFLGDVPVLAAVASSAVMTMATAGVLALRPPTLLALLLLGVAGLASWAAYRWALVVSRRSAPAPARTPRTRQPS